MTTFNADRRLLSSDPGFINSLAGGRLPSTSALAGSDWTVEFEDRPPLELHYRDATELDWTWGGRSGHATYDAVEARDGIYFVDTILPDRPRESISLVAEPATGRVAAVGCVARPEPVPGETQVTQWFAPGILAGSPVSGAAPEQTRDLIGLRVLNIYDDEVSIEHLYLNSERYAWQCLRGFQRGLGNIDLADYYRFGNQTYILTFREFVVPVSAVLFLDFGNNRSTGKFFGVQANGEAGSSPGGAQISILSSTTYPDGQAPK